MEDANLERCALTALETLAGMPAAPYYEQAGASYVRSVCDKARLETEVDPHGNVLVSRPGTDPGAPGMALVAHLDHPGFEAQESDGGAVIAAALGGLGHAAYRPGVGVLFITRDGRRVAGRIAELLSDRRPVRVRFDVARDAVGELPCAVVLDLPDFESDGDLIRMRAADDLAGCAASLAALLHAAESPSPGAVYGLFTRAEEDGLIGARLAAADGLLPVGTVIVSVESSHALSGAEIGGGPVIRVGDRITTFDGSAEAHLQAAAERLRKADVEFQFQRQLMGGGVCEASAFAAFGYAVTGLAFPLGNYHNGLYENVVEAEYIDRRDFIAGARLLAEALEHAGAEASPANKDRLRRRPDDQARRLSESS